MTDALIVSVTEVSGTVRSLGQGERAQGRRCPIWTERTRRCRPEPQLIAADGECARLLVRQT